MLICNAGAAGNFSGDGWRWRGCARSSGGGEDIYKSQDTEAQEKPLESVRPDLDQCDVVGIPVVAGSEEGGDDMGEGDAGKPDPCHPDPGRVRCLVGAERDDRKSGQEGDREVIHGFGGL